MDQVLDDFRRLVLKQFVVIGLACGMLIISLAVLAWLPLPTAQLAALCGFMALSVFLLFTLGRSPQRMALVSGLYLTTTFCIFAFGTVIMAADSMRFVWFYLQVGATFLIRGLAGGWTATAASLAVAMVSATILGSLSPQETATFCISLLGISTIFHAFSARLGELLGSLSRQNRHLLEISRRDPLTGLLNRLGFMQDAGAVLSAPAGTGAMLVFDIDHFKRVNDRFGHAAGDAVLVTVATAMRRNTRPRDIVARLGGEEFGILLPETTQERALAVAEALRRDIEAAVTEFQGQAIRTTVSIGIASSGTPHDTLDAIQHAADKALYVAKEAGRNRVQAQALVPA